MFKINTRGPRFQKGIELKILNLQFLIFVIFVSSLFAFGKSFRLNKLSSIHIVPVTIALLFGYWHDGARCYSNRSVRKSNTGTSNQIKNKKFKQKILFSIGITAVRSDPGRSLHAFSRNPTRDRNTECVCNAQTKKSTIVLLLYKYLQ